MDEKNHEAESQNQIATDESVKPKASITTPKNRKSRNVLNVLLGIVVGILIPVIAVIALSQTGYLQFIYNLRIPALNIVEAGSFTQENGFLKVPTDTATTRHFESIYYTPLEYKISTDWEEEFYLRPDEFEATYYTGNGIIYFKATSSYESDESSADEWVSNEVDFYDRSEKFSLDEFEKIDTETVSNYEFSIYKQVRTYTRPDSEYKKQKVNNSDLEQSETSTWYYAVLKNEDIDIEIQSTNQALVNEFLDGLTIGD